MEITPTPAMIETMIKIMVEMLAVLALATKKMSQGKLSTFCSTCPMGIDSLTRRRKICKKATGGERH